MEKTGQAEAIVTWLKQLDPAVFSQFAKELVSTVGSTVWDAREKMVVTSRKQEEETQEDKKANEMIQLIMQRVPELKHKYMVVLIDKERP
jgi:hypothetical protein